MERIAVMPVGVVIERRRTGNGWQRWSWAPAAVIPRAEGDAGWRVLRQGGGHTLFHAGHRTIELHYRETASYLQSLAHERPAVWVALRPVAGAPPDHAFDPFLVTVSPDEAQAYNDGEGIVGSVPMPGFVAAWVSWFVAAHHRDAPFVRHPRKGSGTGAQGAPAAGAAHPLRRPGWRIPGHHG